MKLRDFQDRFRDLMLDNAGAAAPAGDDFAMQFESGDIALEERVAVYRRNIVGGLGDVMVRNFPYLEKLVGADFLRGMAQAFVLENPPPRGCLNFYGRGFAEFIDGYDAAKSLPYLADMARLEIAMNDSYYAYDDEALLVQDLAGIAPDRLDGLKLSLRQSVQILSSRFPLLALKQFCDDPGGTPQPDMGAGCRLMVIRPDVKVRLVPLEEAEFFALSRLQAGARLGDCVNETLGRHPDFSFEAFLQKHVALESFRSLAPR